VRSARPDRDECTNLAVAVAAVARQAAKAAADADSR
jgi:hypothetical protein